MQDELSVREWKDLIADLRSLGTMEIRFTGGEPTVYKDFQELVEYSKLMGLYISLSTNGVVDSSMLELLKSGIVDYIRVSIDGTKVIHDIIRGRGTFETAIKTVTCLANLSNLRLATSTVVGRYNVNDFAALVEMLSEFRIESISTLPLIPVGRAAAFLSGQSLSRQEWFEFATNVEELKKRFNIEIKMDYNILAKKPDETGHRHTSLNYGCPAGREGCCISPVGDVFACGYTPAGNPNLAESIRKPFIAGNVRIDPIEIIWRDDKRWSFFRQDLLNIKRACMACDYYGFTCPGRCPALFDSNENLDRWCLLPLIEDAHGNFRAPKAFNTKEEKAGL